MGTVRDISNEAKLAPLKKAFGDLYDKMTLKAANLDNEESMLKAIEGATYVIHTASPFPMLMPKNAYELIDPAVSGTKAVLKACH